MTDKTNPVSPSPLTTMVREYLGFDGEKVAQIAGSVRVGEGELELPANRWCAGYPLP